MLWLAQGYEPSYRTINRFRVHPQMQELLRQCFVQFRCQLVEEKLIDQQAIFIDGTKIEANANKFTFRWKKSVEKYHANILTKSNEVYEQLLHEQVIPAIEREQKEQQTIQELTEIATALEEVVEDYTTQIESAEEASVRKQLRSKRKSPKQVLKQVNEWIERKQTYEQDFEIMGERNSYSKTDTDATFMRMKDDYMKNGQLKAGYNVQIATENQYIFAYDIYHNPTNTKTLIPFLDMIEEHYFDLPEHIAADAGYGSEANYENVLTERERTPLITYGMYLKEQKKKYKLDPFKTSNWAYDETTDSYTCPNEKKLSFRYHSTRTDKSGFVRQFKVYECED